MKKCKGADHRKEQAIEESDIVSKGSDQLLVLIISPLPEPRSKSSEERAIDQDIAQLIEVSHIDFALGDRPSILGECVQVVQHQQLKHLMIRSHIQAECKLQKQQHLHFTSKWKTCLPSRRFK